MDATAGDSEGARLRLAREARGWRQVDLAEKAGVDEQTVWRHENGIGGIGQRSLQKYCAVLRVREEWVKYAIGPAPGQKADDIVDKYLKSPMGRSTPRAVAALLRQVSYSSLGVRKPTYKSVHRVRELIETNYLLERQTAHGSASGDADS